MISLKELLLGEAGATMNAQEMKRHLKKLARERYALKNLRRGRPQI